MHSSISNGLNKKFATRFIPLQAPPLLSPFLNLDSTNQGFEVSCTTDEGSTSTKEQSHELAPLILQLTNTAQANRYKVN